VSEFELVIRGATVVLDDGPQRLDVGIEDGVIAALAPELPGGREELPSAGLHVLPGAIDVHVHANDPGRADWEGAGYASAGLAVGGTTTALDMPLNASPPTIHRAGWEAKLAAWLPSAYVDFALWGGIVPGNHEHLHELAELGVIGFKAFMCDAATDDFPAADDASLFAAMQVAAERGLVVAVHAENAAMIEAGAARLRASSERDAAAYLASRPALAEIEAVSRALLLAEEAGCALHIVHLSTGRAVAMVAEARARGVDATCETCAHYLAFTVEDVERIGTAAKCSPPIRTAVEREELWRCAADGGIDMVTTDHAPAPPASKAGDFATAWAGIVGGQLLMSVLVSEGHLRRGLALERIAALLSGRPAERFALAGKGEIAVGLSADLVLVDLAGEHTVTAAELRHRNPALSPYVGTVLRGRAVRTLLRGVTIARDGELAGPPRGVLVRPSAHALANPEPR
jgi:allantoinase